MLNGASCTKGSAMNSLLRTPFWGSSNTIQPKVTASDGRKNVTQNMNSKAARPGTSVRPSNQEMKMAVGSEIDCSPTRSLRLFHTEASIVGSSNAVRQPSRLHVDGLP